jgi:polyisoprenyl-phosphate glycosyltransferase
MNPIISIVSPVYNAEEIIIELIDQITFNLEKLNINYEIILVDDRSTDNSWEIIKNHCLINPKIIGIRLSKNFGQHYAITAGIDNSIGEYTIIMDCDLQDNPKYILDLYHTITSNDVEIVYTIQTKRNHGSLKNLASHIFYLFFNLFTPKENRANSMMGNYSIFSSKVKNAFENSSDVISIYILKFASKEEMKRIFKTIHSHFTLEFYD